MNYLSNLNPAQTEAVLHMDGPLLIFAGAGSGKTRVLTYRVVRLIEQGVDPYHIIAITFTNKAAKEMRERINALTPLGDQVWVSTFHAACTRILRREIQHLGFYKGFSIYDSQDTQRLIKDCIKEKNLDKELYPAAYVANIISAQKNELIGPEEYERRVSGNYRESNIAELYAMYQKKLEAMNAMDFDDIIFKTVELLHDNEDIRRKYQNRFRYVMVDEYQDTNHAQYRLVNLLAGYAQNLCVVGDDDQSIYGWRGANIENILQFERDYPGATVIKLEENYRSTQTILDAANDVIVNNENRADKKLWTQNSKGQPIRVYEAENGRDEGAFVARVINAEVQAGNANYSDFAVLYRANYQSRSIEDALIKASIPYRIYGGIRFYERMEIKDILAYLKAINNPADDVAYLRIINVPKRGIGAVTIEKIQAYALTKQITFSEAVSRASEVPGLGRKAASVAEFGSFMQLLSQFAAEHPVAALVKKILHETKYMDSLADGTPEGEERAANVLELIATVSAFGRDSDDTSLGKFLEDVALVTDIDNYHESANAVSLMTFHSAKGLEFNVVFMVGMEEYVFPTTRSIEVDSPAQMEEERRLCYVGITRAKRLLYITYADLRMRYDDVIYNDPSRFLEEIQPDRLTPVNFMGKPKEFKASSATQQRGWVVTTPHKAAYKPKSPAALPTPKSAPPDFAVGDRVVTASVKYGEGEVLEIRPAGADYEVTILFETAGRKKLMAGLSRITKVSD
ncbi:MAG: UvrD-helicase domain-containing protein [Firmicutes bacterium]|nr:UvrD-helicase domain-containing protein [Bacillota bacterium]